VAYDFLKNFMIFEDEEKFNRLCQALEDVIRDLEDADGKFSEVEIMQALDMVGFNQFRDSWEEFKKMDLQRDFSMMEIGRPKSKKLLN
jgi:hypothetical protein